MGIGGYIGYMGYMGNQELCGGYIGYRGILRGMGVITSYAEAMRRLCGGYAQAILGIGGYIGYRGLCGGYMEAILGIEGY